MVKKQAEDGSCAKLSKTIWWHVYSTACTHHERPVAIPFVFFRGFRHGFVALRENPLYGHMLSESPKVRYVCPRAAEIARGVLVD